MSHTGSLLFDDPFYPYLERLAYPRNAFFGPLVEATGLEINALSLVFSLVTALPAGALYIWLFSKSTNRFNKVAFLSAVGHLHLYMNYPLEFHYITFSITVTWLCLKLLGPNVAMCTVNSVFNMGFLLYAYRCYETDDYDINWTTAQCVMCLRNISLGFDYMDGETLKQEGAEKLSSDQVVNSIDTPPSYLEMLGFSLFFPCVLVGPQVTYRHFRNYLDTYIPGYGGRPTRREHLIPALYSFAEGIMYFVGSQVLSYPAEHFFSQEYQHEWNLWQRYQFFFLHSITFFWRYFGCWKLAESACQLTGAAYLGRKENGKIHWGLHNFHSWRFFSGINLDEIIKTFNINTNYWVMRIVFKRLRWLGNKNASQLGALFFLAIWHGFHTSYFLAFGMEFYELFAERGIRKWASGLIEYVDQSPAPIRFAGMLFAWVSRCTMLGNGVILFEMLDVMKGLEVHKSLYFLPTILPTIYLIIPMVLPPPMRKKKISVATTDDLKKDQKKEL